jgi:hypothetical protein
MAELINGMDVVILVVATAGALVVRELARAWALHRNRASVGKSRRRRE